jgi:hypothetical protein
MIRPLNRAVAIWTDRARRWSRRKLFSAALLLASLLASAFGVTSPAQAEKRIALVIGNSNYQNVPQLANPAADAKATGQMLSAIGFRVDLQIDVDNLSLKRALRRFEDDANQADIAVIYFAGHGLEVRGVNYLIPIDAKLADERDAPDEAIALDRLVEAVSSATQLGLIILDACRDNPFSIRMKRQTASRSLSRGLARIEPEGAETLIAYAAKAGSTAEDGHGPHSPFTTALLDNLPTPGLDVELAFRRVRDEVLNVTGDRQEPFTYGSLSGKPIYLVPSEKPSVSPPPADQNSAELLFWTSVKDSRVAADYRAYLARYPSGIFAVLAANRIAELERSPSMPPTDSSAAFSSPRPDELAWQLLKETSDEAALKHFAAQYPDSPLRKDAEARIAALEAAHAAQPKPPSPQEIVWNLVKDSTDLSELRRFVKQFPDSARRVEAEQKIAALTAAAEITSANNVDPHALAVSLQFELKRVGCFNGVLNGELDEATRAAARNFAKFASIKMPDELSPDAVKAVRGFNRRVCPLVCAKGERTEGDRCVVATPTHKEEAKKKEPHRRVTNAAGPHARGKCFSFGGRNFCE